MTRTSNHCRFLRVMPKAKATGSSTILEEILLGKTETNEVVETKSLRSIWWNCKTALSRCFIVLWHESLMLLVALPSSFLVSSISLRNLHKTSYLAGLRGFAAIFVDAKVGEICKTALGEVLFRGLGTLSLEGKDFSRIFRLCCYGIEKQRRRSRCAHLHHIR
jgi:hypothetical protein